MKYYVYFVLVTFIGRCWHRYSVCHAQSAKENDVYSDRVHLAEDLGINTIFRLRQLSPSERRRAGIYAAICLAGTVLVLPPKTDQIN